MRILAIDTATESCSVAVAHDGKIASRSIEAANRHAQQILPMIDALLMSEAITLQSLNAIAVGIGPGAFTGVRIGVSVAQALAFAASLPVIAVNSLEALAMTVVAYPAAVGDILACLDARMGEIYWGVYRSDARHGLIQIIAPQVGVPDAARNGTSGRLHGVGRGFSAYPALASIPGLSLAPDAAMRLPQAEQIARLGLIRAQLGQWLDPALLQPLYVRNRVAHTEIERGAAPNA